MKALIVDDEKLARNALRQLCTLCCPAITSMAEAATIAEAIQYIQQEQPDLIFLDINIGQDNGFELLEALAHLPLNIIFVTAHSEYGIRALKASAIDYLLKPLKSTELIQAVQKAKDKIDQQQENSQLNTLLVNLHQQQNEVQRLIIKTAESIHLINVSDIVYCQSDKGYTTFKLADNTSIISSKNLAEYESILPKRLFMRVHQSYLVNLPYVVRYDKRYNTLVTIDKAELPVALRRKEQLMHYLNNLV